MSWDAIGAIGEILGALATVIMLVYLSIQIRHARETTQSATELEASKLLAHYTQITASSRDLQRIWDQVAENSSDISDEDLSYHLWKTAAFLHAAEGVWEQYQRGLVSDRIWMEWERTLCGILKPPLVLGWWTQRSAPYSPEFYDYFDQAISKKDEWVMPSSSQVIGLIKEAGK